VSLWLHHTRSVRNSPGPLLRPLPHAGRLSRAAAKDEGESEGTSRAAAETAVWYRSPSQRLIPSYCWYRALPTFKVLFLQIRTRCFWARTLCSTTSRSAALRAARKRPLAGPVRAMQHLHGCSSPGVSMTKRPKRPKLVPSLSVRFHAAKGDRNLQAGEQETTFCRLNDMTW
jgi:hypothetical protein